MRQWQQQRETWDADDLRIVDQSAEVGNRIAVRFVWRGEGHGPESAMEITVVNTMRGGKILGQDYFWDHAEALEILGLSE